MSDEVRRDPPTQPRGTKVGDLLAGLARDLGETVRHEVEALSAEAGERAAVTLAAGAVGYRWQRFAAFGAVAATTWGAYSALVGYVGGVAFEQDPVKGLLLGFGLAATMAATSELGRHLLRRRREAPSPAQLVCSA